MISALHKLTKPKIEQLKKEVSESARLNVYKSGASFPLDAAELLQTPITPKAALPTLEIDASESQLKRAQSDCRFAIELYEALADLSELEASDHRLWICLTHTTYFTYTQRRWPSDGSTPEQMVDQIHSHWFVEGGRQGLRRNAIARLWWAAHLTVSPWDKDPELAIFNSVDKFKYTRLLLHSQQVYQDLMERSFGGSPRLRICLLESLSSEFGKVTSDDQLVKEVVKLVNLISSYRSLESLTVQSLHTELKKLVEGVADGLRGLKSSPAQALEGARPSDPLQSEPLPTADVKTQTDSRSVGENADNPEQPGPQREDVGDDEFISTIYSFLPDRWTIAFDELMELVTNRLGITASQSIRDRFLGLISREETAGRLRIRKSRVWRVIPRR